MGSGTTIFRLDNVSKMFDGRATPDIPSNVIDALTPLQKCYSTEGNAKHWPQNQPVKVVIILS